MSSLRSPNLVIKGKTPLLISGTAFKGPKTAELVEGSLKAGFSAVDSADYPTMDAYDEVAIGKGIAAAISAGTKKREDIFIQSKFAPAYAHQPDKLPFNVDQPVEDQVREAVEKSFKSLQVDYIDAYILFLPFLSDDDTLKAWTVLESYVPHRVGALGVSNFTADQLKLVWEKSAAVKPAIVQNRFFADNGFDDAVRAFAKEKGILYQAYWMLKGDPKILESAVVAKVAEKLAVEKTLAYYVLIWLLGDTQVLSGSSNVERMATNAKTAEKLLSDPALIESLQPLKQEFEETLKELSPKKD